MKNEWWWVKLLSKCRCDSVSILNPDLNGVAGVCPLASATCLCNLCETYFCTHLWWILDLTSSICTDWRSQKCGKEILRLSDLCIHLFIYTQRRHFNIVINNNEVGARMRVCVSISDYDLFWLAAFITVCLHTLAKVSGGCRSDGGPKPWAQINLLFNLIMRFGVGCLSPINTTVIAFEEEWAQAAHKGTLTLACTPKYVSYKSNCTTQAHTGADTHAHRWTHTF